MRSETLAAAVIWFASAALGQPAVHTVRVPDGGIQPQAATTDNGTLHLLYYKGDPKAGDLWYSKRAHGQEFSAPIRMNSQPGSAVAIGNDRGGHIAVGKGGRVHVAWNGSSLAQPKGPKNPAMAADNANNGLPMLYSRLNDAGTAFEPQRNVMTSTFALDGGGSVAADSAGNVYVVFHAGPVGTAGKSEAERRVFVASSADEGATFAPEQAVSDDKLGACGCCGLKAMAGPRGEIGILFRSASTPMDRDAVFLSSRDGGKTFAAELLQPWKIGACPMTTSAIYPTANGWVVAWETKGNVFARVLAGTSGDAAAGVLAPAESDLKRKYPSIAVNKAGQVLLAWTEGMAWSKGGNVAWQVFDAGGKPVAGASGRAEGVPAWSLVAAIAEPDGSFTVLY